MKKYITFCVCVIVGLFVAVEYTNAQDRSMKWERIRGDAVDIAVGEAGQVAAVDTNGRVYRYDHAGDSWRPIGKLMVHVAVDKDGVIWAVDKSGKLRRYSGASWNSVGTGAVDVVAGRDGLIFVTTNTGSIARYDYLKRQWQAIDGHGVRLAVDAQNRLWRVDKQGNVARLLDDAWIGVEGKAQDITADKDGRVFIVGQDQRLYQWVENETRWNIFPGNFSAVAVAADDGQVWRIEQDGKIFAHGITERHKNKDKGIEIGEPGDGATDGNTIPDLSAIVFERVSDTRVLADLSIGQDGSVFALNSSGDIYRWSNTEQRFNTFPGTVNQIAVRDNGLPIAIGTKKSLVEHDGEAWRLINLNEDLRDLALYGDDRVLAVNSRDQVAKLSENLQSFTLLPQKGQQIVAQDDGAFWVIDSVNRLFQCSAEGRCQQQSIKAQDLSIGPGGSVFVVDTNATLRRFNASENSFDIIRQGDTARVAVGPKDRPWILDNQGRVLQSAYFERDESGDRNLALKTTATEKVTQQASNAVVNTGIQITQSISFTAVNIPTSAGGVNLGGGMRDITAGYYDIIIASGFDDSPCVNGSGRNWVYNPLSRSFSHLDYLQRMNLNVGIAVEELVRGDVNGDTPPASPSPAIPSLVLEWDQDCGSESVLTTYVSSVFNDPSAQFSQSFGAATFSSALDDFQEPDLDYSADGYVFNVAPSDELEFFKPETANDVSFFDAIDFMRVGVGKTREDIWAVSTTYNVYEFVSGTDSFELRSVNVDDKAQDVGVGQDGTVFIVNTAGVLKKWDPTAKRFIRTNKSGVTRVAVDSRGNPIVANFPDSQTVYFGR